LNGNPFGALLNIYSDASIVVEHSGIEMGQGIDTRMAQLVAKELIVDVSKVTVIATNTRTIPNAGCTAGTTGTAVNAMAVQAAAKDMAARLKPARDALGPNATWEQVIAKAVSMGIDLSTRSWTTCSGPDMMNYFSYAVVVSESQIDILTGETHILRVDILYDAGYSLNPVLDLGQCIGGFVQSLGYFLTEEVNFDAKGRMSLWQEYTAPSAKDIPIDFRVALLKDTPNPTQYGVLGSKGVGEQPFVSGCSSLLTVRDAVAAARAEAGRTEFFAFNAPATVEAVHLACLVNTSQFHLK
jgi:xanthine dehydrogenase/oxidase